MPSYNKHNMSGIKNYLKKKLNSSSRNISSLDKSSIKKNTKSINNHLQEKGTEDNRTLKLLLLGAGGSGKSTIMKQMDRMYNKSMSKQTSNYKNIIIIHDRYR